MQGLAYRKLEVTMTDELLDRLKALATDIKKTDTSGLRQRWQFGQELLPLRDSIPMVTVQGIVRVA